MGSSVRTLLENGLYLSIADREYNPVEPDGSQINVALNHFVKLLDIYRDQVPFWQTKTLDGEAALINVGASAINYVQYFIGKSRVAYNLKPLTQNEFSSVETVKDLRAIPEWFWWDEGADTILVYPLPQNSDDQFIIGFKPLNIVNCLDESLDQSLKPFMQAFLEYELARHLSNEYTVPWTPNKEVTRQFYYKKLLANGQYRISQPVKPSLTRRQSNVPWLAYLSGQTP